MILGQFNPGFASQNRLNRRFRVKGRGFGQQRQAGCLHQCRLSRSVPGMINRIQPDPGIHRRRQARGGQQGRQTAHGKTHKPHLAVASGGDGPFAGTSEFDESLDRLSMRESLLSDHLQNWGRKKFKGEKSAPLKALPRAHQAASLFKRWIPGTHQAAIGHQHLGDSLHEFVFRFNRRKSDSRGKFFFRLAQQAIPITPTTYELLVRPQPVAPC